MPSPNRLAIYLAALANVLAALLPILTDVGATDLIAPVAGLNVIVLAFLKGWQQYEQARYDAEQVQYQLNARAEQVAQAQAPRIGGNGIKLPR